MAGDNTSRSPGPGAYMYKEVVGKEGTMSTMRPRRSCGTFMCVRDVPGPGAYESFYIKRKAPAYR